mgnify:FL=1
MKIAIYRGTAPHHTFSADKFIDGLKKHGQEYEIWDMNAPGKCDLLVTWGMRNIDKFKGKYRNFLLLEAAYLQPRIDTKSWPLWYSLGFNGLNGRGTYLNENKDSTRFNKHFDDGRVKPYREAGNYILVTMQVPGDASLRHFTGSYDAIIEGIKKVVDLPTLIRPHPKAPSTRAGVISCREPLEKQLDSAKALVTINSNSGVDSLVYGVPVLNLDPGSMCWDLAMKDFSELTDPPKPDRTQWLNNLAWCQWLPEEVALGDAWEHLKTNLEILNYETN